jgi:DNA helicase-2/ATP-dependent DNA helicase PcrA
MVNLNELNPSQRQAAMTVKGPVLILAGAGSGKTRTVIYRIAHMINDHRIDPRQILAVSFTNKAAGEMNERLKKLVGARKKRGITLCTFHSLGIRILRQDIDKIGYNKDFTIYDQGDQISIVREGLKLFNADKNAYDKKTILSKIGNLKNHGISAEEFKNSDYFDEHDDYDVATEYVYHYYQDKLHFYNALDFDDIIYLVVKLFKSHPDVANKWSERFKYLIIDEYQDTNGLQFEMVRGLTSMHNNICVVGDDDQSIYAFRGADITNILNFEKNFDNTQVIKLEQNYRSTSKILNLANEVIRKNVKRKDKTMFSTNHDGPDPLLWSCGNSDHEAQIVVDEIVKHQAEGKSLADISILYRSNTQIPPFEDQLRLAQVPYKVIGGQKFYDKKEIKDIIAFLSVIYNTKDELSIRRILNVPQRGIGSVSLKRFLSMAHDSHIPLFLILEELSQKPDEKKHKELAQFVGIIRKYQGLFRTMKLSQAISSMLDEIHYLKFVEKSYDSPKVAARKKDDVRNFILSTERFEERFKEEATLQSYLERLLLADSQDNRNGEDDDKLGNNEVTLMTLHSSKGLEFDTVFLVGMEEELLPHKRTIQEGEDIDEERRLAYVGLTRAKRRLIMTYAQERRIYGKDIKRHKSRFIEELDNFHIPEYDRTSFGHLSEEEAQQYKQDFFGDLLKSLD